jgi:thioesterase domain-containing protein
VALPLTVVFQAPTFASLVRLVREGGWQPAWQSLVPVQPSGSRPPLFLVHGIGGGVLCFRDLARHLGPVQPLYGLQAVSLGGARQEFDCLADMAAHYVRELRSLQPEGPYRIGGLSFGGTVAFEMAQQLVAAGQEVALLALLDSKGEDYPRFPSSGARVLAHLRSLAMLKTADRRHYLEVRIRGAWDLLRRLVLLRIYRRRAISVFRALDDIGIAHIDAALAYHRKPYPGCITLFRAAEQPVGCIPNPTNGWERLALGGVEVVHVPGEHATIIEEPHVATLARRLREVLASTEAS